jgi:Protein of unknwon function (DUF3310)
VKRQTKTDKIRNMLHDGEDVATIAKKVKVSKSYVYAVKGRMKKAKKRKQEQAVINAEAELDAPMLVGPRSALDEQIGGDHYKEMQIQPVQFIVANGIGFLEGCIIKRVCRWRTKGGVMDLEKAKHELDLLIELAD